MGLFTRSKKEPQRDVLEEFEDGTTFWMPGNRADVVGVFANYASDSPEGTGSVGFLIRDYLEKYGNQFGVTAGAPAAPEIYADMVSDSQIVIRAGSRVKELWNVQVDLRDSGNGVDGSARFFPNWGPGEPAIWFINVVRIRGSLRGAVMLSGGRWDGQ